MLRTPNRVSQRFDTFAMTTAIWNTLVILATPDKIFQRNRSLYTNSALLCSFHFNTRYSVCLARYIVRKRV